MVEGVTSGGISVVEGVVRGVWVIEGVGRGVSVVDGVRKVEGGEDITVSK